MDIEHLNSSPKCREWDFLKHNRLHIKGSCLKQQIDPDLVQTDAQSSLFQESNLDLSNLQNSAHIPYSEILHESTNLDNFLTNLSAMPQPTQNLLLQEKIIMLHKKLKKTLDTLQQVTHFHHELAEVVDKHPEREYFTQLIAAFDLTLQHLL